MHLSTDSNKGERCLIEARQKERVSFTGIRFIRVGDNLNCFPVIDDEHVIRISRDEKLVFGIFDKIYWFFILKDY